METPRPRGVKNESMRSKRNFVEQDGKLLPLDPETGKVDWEEVRKMEGVDIAPKEVKKREGETRWEYNPKTDKLEQVD